MSANPFSLQQNVNRLSPDQANLAICQIRGKTADYINCMDAAWDLVEDMRAVGFQLEMTLMPQGVCAIRALKFNANFGASGFSPQTAICRLWLRWQGFSG